MRNVALTGLCALFIAFFTANSVGALNECGTLVVGGTVTCTNPTYSSGIAYNNAGTIIVDATGAPIAVTGPFTGSSASSVTPSSLITIGKVTINRAGSISTNNVGSWLSTAARNFSITLSSETTVTTERTTANGYNYAVSAAGRNAHLAIQSAGTIRAIHSGGGYTYLTPLAARDWYGGANSRVEIQSTGLVYADVTNATSGQVWAIYAGSTGVGSPLPVKVAMTNAILVQSNATSTSFYGVGIQVVNYGVGGTEATQSGDIELQGSYGGAYGIYTEGIGDSNITVSAPLNIQNNLTGASVENYGVFAANDKKATIRVTGAIDVSGDGTVSAITVQPYTTGLTTNSYDISTQDGGVIKSSGTGIDVSGAGSGGTIALGSGTSLMSGTGQPAILGSVGRDVITSSANVTGDIELSNGNDELVVQGGSLHGAITGGDGDDRIEIHSSTDTAGLTSIDGGSGNNVLVIDGSVLAGFSSSGSGVQITNFKSIEIINGASLTFGGSDLMTTLGDVTIASDATLKSGNNTGTFQVGGSLSHQGTVSLQQTTTPVASDTLVVTQNYVAGGSLLLDAQLDSPTTSKTDILTVDGDIIDSGSPTTITLRRISGNGAQTTGKGILVVSVQGESPSTAFTLAGGEMRVGNFMYRLVHDEDGNWYLRSTEIPTPPSSQTGQAVAIPKAPNTGSGAVSIEFASIIVAVFAVLGYSIRTLARRMRHSVR